jgi:hypothetical protein
MSPVPATSLRSYTVHTIQDTSRKKERSSAKQHISPLHFNSLLSGIRTLLSKNKLNSTFKMAPITRLSTPLLRSITQRRGFSIISRVRQTARSFEPHPFERTPITQKTAPADYGKLVRHVGDAAMLCVPLLWIPLPLFILGNTNDGVVISPR